MRPSAESTLRYVSVLRVVAGWSLLGISFNFPKGWYKVCQSSFDLAVGISSNCWICCGHDVTPSICNSRAGHLFSSVCPWVERGPLRSSDLFADRKWSAPTCCGIAGKTHLYTNWAEVEVVVYNDRDINIHNSRLSFYSCPPAIWGHSVVTPFLFGTSVPCRPPSLVLGCLTLSECRSHVTLGGSAHHLRPLGKVTKPPWKVLESSTVSGALLWVILQVVCKGLFTLYHFVLVMKKHLFRVCPE